MTAFANPDAYEIWMGRWSARLAPLFADFVALPPGARVLDVGCGTGALARALIGSSDASVVGIDPSAGYVELCRRALNDPRLDFQTGDALAIPFPDASFDASLSLLILQELPDVPRAIAEMRRVTRPGGIVAASQWDFAEGMPMLAHFWDTVLDVAPSDAARRTARDCMEVDYPDETALRGLWRSSGLVDVTATQHAIDMTFASFEDYWRPFLSNVSPTSSFPGTMSEEERARLEDSLRRRIFAAVPPGPFTLEAHAWSVRGRVAET